MATTKNFTANYGTIQTAVPSGSSITVPFPAGSTLATFASGTYAGLGTVITNKNNVYKESAGQCAFAYGAGGITITNTSGVPWAVGDILDYGVGGANTQGYNYTGAASASFGTLATAGAAIAAVAGVVTIPDVGAAYSQAAINNALATLAAAVNANRQALLTAGITF